MNIIECLFGKSKNGRVSGFTFRQDHADRLREMSSEERNACIDEGMEWALRVKNDIERLIVSGDVEGALALMSESVDARLLRVRYYNGKKQYNFGLIEFAEWKQIMGDISQEILKSK